MHLSGFKLFSEVSSARWLSLKPGINTECHTGTTLKLHIHTVSGDVPAQVRTQPVYREAGCTYRVQGGGVRQGTVRGAIPLLRYTGTALFFSSPRLAGPLPSLFS